MRMLMYKVNLNFDASFHVFSTIPTATCAFVGHKYTHTGQLLLADKTPGENGLFTINSKSTSLPSCHAHVRVVTRNYNAKQSIFQTVYGIRIVNFCACVFSTRLIENTSRQL